MIFFYKLEVSNISLDINECEENQDNCNGKAKCINTDGSFQCKCLDGYTGDGITCSGN